MSYVDGFVIPMKKKNVPAYKKMATEGCKIWKKFGAVGYFECVGEELTSKMPGMNMIGFPKMAKLKAGEVVFFSFIVFKSKAHRNLVNKKVMAYFSKKYGKDASMEMPFDPKRMAYGGFKAIVEG